MSFHNVYANDRSICNKSGDGKSAAAFPDTCWTPPQSSPIPVPYPNTAFASDLTNGTKTVFIQGTEVAKKDISYFATSTGDEPATPSCGKGLITGALEGKAYFFSWSMDVKAEGQNVCRHLDMMGHNHASIPSNTPLFPFIERGFFTSNPCKKEEERIERACAKEEDNEDTKKFKPKKKKRFNRLRKKKTGGSSKSGPWHWKDDHCDGLEFFPSLDGAKEFLKDLENAYNELFSQEALLDAAKAELADFLKGAALKAGGKVLAKAGVKQLGGSSLPLIGNIAMGLWTAYDVVHAVGSISELKRVFAELVDYVKTLKDKLPKLKDLLDRYKTEGGSAKLMADVMDIIATINACTRARKCNLVPYSTKDRKSKVETSTGGGCCGGQTGHHLIPGAMAEGACPNYKHSEAPTVCVEGANQNQGSHKRIHDATDAMLGASQKAGKISAAGKISQDDAINAAVAAHKIAFPLSGCSAKCIKAQLEKFYKDACGNAKMNAKDKQGRLITDDSAGSSGTK